MSMHPPDDRPTTVHPAAVQPATEQLTVTAAPATRRSRRWGQRIPARIGRARTSTVVIGCLFLLLYALHIAVEPDPVEYTTVVDSNTGTRLTVPASLVPSAPATPKAPSSTAGAPATTSAPTSAPTSAGTPATTTGAPRSSTTAPRSSSATSTAPRTSTSPSEDATTAAPRSSSEPPPATPAETSVAPTS